MEWVIVPFAILLIVLGFFGERIMRIREGRYVYRGSIPEDREQFLSDVFDLTREDADFLHFDGFDIHFPTPIAYTDFSRVQLVQSMQVEVRNPKLPYIRAWRVPVVDRSQDGGLRLSEGRMVSYKYRLRFDGVTPRTLVSFTVFRETRAAIEKFNRLLESAPAVDLGARFAEYADAYSDLKEQEAQLRQAQQDRARPEPTAEVQRLDAEIARLNEEVSAATRKVQRVIKRTRRDLIIPLAADT